MVTKKLAKKDISNLKADFLEQEEKEETFLKENKKHFKPTSPYEKALFPMRMYGKHNQVSPDILLINMPRAKCGCCRNVNDSYVPEVKWSFNGRNFVYKFICKSCLDAAGIIYMTNAQIARFIALNKGHVYKIFDYTEKGFCNVCMLEDDCKRVRLKVYSLMLDVSLCTKHGKKVKIMKNDEKLETMTLEQSIKEIEEMADQLDIEQTDWVKELKSFNDGYMMEGL